MPKIIGFTGIAGSGKDTAANIIKDEYNVDIFALAEPLKTACKILFNFSNEQLYNTELKEEIDKRWNKTPRQILQWLGTDILRKEINEDFFLINIKNRIDSSTKDYILITDIRFDNEAEYIKSLGGKIIKINRDMNLNNGKTTTHSNHITEKGISLELIDIIINNNDTLEDYRKNVLYMFDKILI